VLAHIMYRMQGCHTWHIENTYNPKTGAYRACSGRARCTWIHTGACISLSQAPSPPALLLLLCSCLCCPGGSPKVHLPSPA
jgi:hypothetical protein